MVDAAIRKIVENYILLKSEGIPITKAIFFGSYADGIPSPNSDIDLFLVSPIFDKFNDKCIGKIWRLTKNFNYRIEPIAVGEKIFNSENDSPIIATAKIKGYEIAA